MAVVRILTAAIYKIHSIHIACDISHWALHFFIHTNIMLNTRLALFIVDFSSLSQILLYVL